MIQPITRVQHGFTDYSYIPLVASAPYLLGFKDNKTATTLSYVLSSNILASSLLTRAEWGAFKVIPYKAHLVLDVVTGLTALSAPWLFGFAKDRKARTAFLVAGAFGILAGLLSKPEEMPKYA
jgi:hypothetical protein